MTSDAGSRAPEPSPLRAQWLGRVGYDEAWERQRDLFARRVEGRVPDTLLLLEHPPTYTLGRRSVREDLLYDEEQRAALGIEVFEVDRGGRATCHAPGQLVGYPIMALGDRYDVIGYLRRLEQAVILTAADLGVSATTDPEHTGVWVGRTKLCAIGVKVTRGVTMHGFALNVTTNLELFQGIVPCGISDRGVTSISAQTGTDYDVADVAALAARRLSTVFGRPLEWMGAGELVARAEALVDH
jgi:lipoyl(octanoyl) transferase